MHAIGRSLEFGRIMSDYLCLSGIGALALLPRLQAEADRANGLNTAGYISGYRGSPLGGLDKELARHTADLDPLSIVVQPAVNEELAATAIWGTQQGQLLDRPRYDGVFAMWYGKGPGVDRAGDALHHGNLAGTAEHGGVLVAAGDDHQGKSSTTAHQSDQALAAYGIPVLSPTSVEEILRFGLLGWAMSRHAGLWVGLKCVNETAEATATIAQPTPASFHIPAEEATAPSVNVSWNLDPKGADIRLAEIKLPRAVAFARANGVDTRVIDPPAPVLGIVTSGKAYGDVLSALDLLGISREEAARVGIGLYKVGLVWPMDGQGLSAFAQGYRELLFVEEKRPVIEDQARALLYSADSPRPWITGKRSVDGSPLLPSADCLTARAVAQAIFQRLDDRGLASDVVRARHAALTPPSDNAPPSLARLPYFCSGCPHNRSTRTPDGSLAFSGIGCHTMAIWMNRQTMPPTQMGGEGANWVGMAPFASRAHVFQNLGDGTYFHSGILAIRQAVAARVNITYKILFNAAVAMTGGQPHDGELTPGAIAAQALAEGVAEVVVVSEFPDALAPTLPHGVALHPRTDLDAVQRRLATVPGVTVLIFDQTCAIEKRRRRKRGTLPTPAMRLFINSAVCEGCGDCSAKSNCVSLKPVVTKQGVKRMIDQSTCNQDFSCADGFCPSFVSVERAPVSAKRPDGDTISIPSCDAPAPFAGDPDTGWDIAIAGIGGTGVVTLGQIIIRAAARRGLRATSFDMTGLSQKNGAVLSHIRIHGSAGDPAAIRIPARSADLLLACDQVTATMPDVAGLLTMEKTVAVAEANIEPTAHLQLDPGFRIDRAEVSDRLRAKVRQYDSLPAAGTAKALFGAHELGNIVLLGAALQRGLLPFKREDVAQAIADLGIPAKGNLAALDIGRAMAAGVALPDADTGPADDPEARTVEQIIADNCAHLAAYQGPALAETYRALVARVAAAEAVLMPDGQALQKAVATTYARLLAYKDEYEVARLLTDPAFTRQLEATFGPGARATYHMAPPLLARRDPATGDPRKRRFGPWIRPALRLMARLRVLRGSPLDPFGWTQERKTERALITRYETLADEAAQTVTPATYDLWAERLNALQDIKGFGHVKLRNLEIWETRDADLARRIAGTATDTSASHHAAPAA